jgi:hypothetical protein
MSSSVPDLCPDTDDECDGLLGLADALGEAAPEPNHDTAPARHREVTSALLYPHRCALQFFQTTYALRRLGPCFSSEIPGQCTRPASHETTQRLDGHVHDQNTSVF